MMHDYLLENSLMYKELVQEGRIKGLEEGRARGIETGRTQGIEQGIRRSVEAVVQTRFPDLVDLARTRTERIQDQQRLYDVLVAMSAASTEREAGQYLLALPEK